MSESAAPRINALYRLPDDFWPRLIAQPYKTDLFQLLRRIDAQGGQAYPLGRAPLPRHEMLRLGQEPSLSFAPSTLSGVRPRPGTPLHEVSIYSFGLFGPNGPLPLHLTEYVRGRIHHHHDTALADFANLFHHRLTLLFYRAWADAQPTVSLDRPDNHKFDDYMSSLIGNGQPAQRNCDSLSDHAKHFMTGHLTRHSHDPEGLSKILRHYFRVPVRIVENVPQWMMVDRRDQAQLRKGRTARRLGQSSFLGIAVRDVQHKFRIELGPMPLETYEGFLPGGKLCQQLRDWVRQYLGIEFVWEVKLILAKASHGGMSLGGGQKLGLSSWSVTEKSRRDAGDLVFSLEGLENSGGRLAPEGMR